MVKTFFGISFNEKINDDSISLWLGKLIFDITLQERTLRNFLFGVKILKLGLFKGDKDINLRIELFNKITKDALLKRL